jgi:hypothetical protein
LGDTLLSKVTEKHAWSSTPIRCWCLWMWLTETHPRVVAPIKSINQSTQSCTLSRSDLVKCLAVIVRYDRHEGERAFLRQYHHCQICFTESAGPDCVRFVICNHVYCKVCGRDQTTLGRADKVRRLLKRAHVLPVITCTSTRITGAEEHTLMPAHLQACLRGYFTSQVQDGAVTRLLCPEPGCGIEVLPTEVS